MPNPKWWFKSTANGSGDSNWSTLGNWWSVRELLWFSGSPADPPTYTDGVLFHDITADLWYVYDYVTPAWVAVTSNDPAAYNPPSPPWSSGMEDADIDLVAGETVFPYADSVQGIGYGLTITGVCHFANCNLTGGSSFQGGTFDGDYVTMSMPCTGSKFTGSYFTDTGGSVFNYCEFSGGYPLVNYPGNFYGCTFKASCVAFTLATETFSHNTVECDAYVANGATMDTCTTSGTVDVSGVISGGNHSGMINGSTSAQFTNGALFTGTFGPNVVGTFNSYCVYVPVATIPFDSLIVAGKLQKSAFGPYRNVGFTTGNYHPDLTVSGSPAASPMFGSGNLF